MNRLVISMAWGLVLIVAITVTSCHTNDTANMTVVQRLRSGALDVVLLSPHAGLRHGKDTLTIEFRSTVDGSLVDVGNARITANMPMPGMPMFGTIEVQRTSVPGRYTVSSDLGMAGSWRMFIDWDGPRGQGSVTFSGTVQ